MRISDWSSDVCSSDLRLRAFQRGDDVDDLGWAVDAAAGRLYVAVEAYVELAIAAALQLGLDPAPRGSDAGAVRGGNGQRMPGLESDQLADMGLDAVGRDGGNDLADLCLLAGDAGLDRGLGGRSVGDVGKA